MDVLAVCFGWHRPLFGGRWKIHGTPKDTQDWLMIMITNMPQVPKSETFWHAFARIHHHPWTYPPFQDIYFHIIHSPPTQPSPAPIPFSFSKCEFLRIIIVWLLVLYISCILYIFVSDFGLEDGEWQGLFTFPVENRLINWGRNHYKRCAPSLGH